MIDSLEQELKIPRADTNRVNCLVLLARIYTNQDPSLALKYGTSALKLANRIYDQKGIIKSLKATAFIYAISSQWKQAFTSIYRGLAVSESYSPETIVDFYNLLALVYEKQNNKTKRLWALFKAYHSSVFKISPLESQARVYYNLGEAYETVDKLDSARQFIQKANRIASENSIDDLIHYTRRVSGRIALKEGHFQEALSCFHQAIQLSLQLNNHFFAVENYLELAQAFHTMEYADSAVHYGTLALAGSTVAGNYVVMAGASKILSEELEVANPSAAIGHLKTMIAANDSLFNSEKIRQAQNVIDLEQQRIQDLKAAKEKYQYRLQLYALLILLASVIVIAGILFFSNRQKKIANELLFNQKEEIQLQKDRLVSTQAQLIQSEKLASLGELTAGIAHEIQNPLNFVNNFAEVSAEMLVEMDAELDKGDVQEAKAISADLQQNLSKINHHGQRASSIVKGMLEHSRQGRDVASKVSTDLNALTDEYLRLAYHGWRAKDNSFNCNIETHFELDLPLVEVVPQDIGRVLLNLINNAFYAVQQQAIAATDVETRHALSLQRHPQNQSSPLEYQPTVTITTQKTADHILIKIQDNGNGIPEAIRDKIFQPFFTTKPTGQGTGLGLSLAYDIVTKGHGGAMEVVSNVADSDGIIDRVGSEFKISLPFITNG